MAKTYELDTTVSASSLLARAKNAAYANAAYANAASLLGDEGSGRFSHELVKGEYRMAGQKVVVTITEKHWLLPQPIVEVRLTAGCIDTGLPAGRRNFGQSVKTLIETANVHHAR